MEHRDWRNHPYFTGHNCERCEGTGTEFYCEKCDVVRPMDCIHFSPWVEDDPNWENPYGDDEDGN